MIVLSAVCAGMSAWFFLARRNAARLHSLSRNDPVVAKPSMSIAARRALSVGGVALIGWTLGDLMGAIIGGLIGLWWSRIWAARESRPSDAYDIAIVRDAPVMLDLLCATLSSGATIRDSMEAVRGALASSPVSEPMSRVIAAMDLGADPREAWSPWIKHSVLGGLAQAITRSHDSGAALIEVLGNQSRELRREHQRRVEVAARSAGVKAVLPLAACFLPAFFALGVVPIVASLATSTGFLGY